MRKNYGCSLETINNVKQMKMKALKAGKPWNQLIINPKFEKRLMKGGYYSKDIPEKIEYLKRQFLKHSLHIDPGVISNPIYVSSPHIVSFSSYFKTVFHKEEYKTKFAKYCKTLYSYLEEEYPEEFL